LLQQTNELLFFQRLKRYLKFFLYDVDVSINRPATSHDVLIWPVQLIHLDFLLPVYDNLMDLGLKVSFINLREDLEKKITDHNASNIKIELRESYKIRFRNFKRGAKLINVLFKARAYNKLDKHFSANVEKALCSFYFWEIYSKVFDLAQETYSPKYHLLGYEFSVVCRPVNIKANNLLLPTGHVQHGNINYNISKYSICTQQFVWDNLTLNYLNNLGLKNEVYLTGSPGLKHLPADLADGSIYFNIKGKYNRIILVCFSGPGHNVTPEGHRINLSQLKSTIEENLDILFLIKLHPKDGTTFYHQIVSLSNVLMVDHNHKNFRDPIGNFIVISDCIITGASTVAVEALLNNKPVISMDLIGELNHVEFLKSSMIYNCKSGPSFEKAFDSIIKQDNSFTARMLEIGEYSKTCKQLLNDSPGLKIGTIIKTKVALCVA
jgi:hypothetical protein